MVTSIADLGPVQVLPLASLTPYPANARRITQRAVELTAESLRLFGWQQPMVADPERVLVVGHVRHRAALSLGEATGPVIIAEHLSPAQLKAYRIADNRTHDYTTWDYGLLAAELDEVGDDFARVLDLADWKGLLAQFDQAQADGADYLTDPAARAKLTGQLTLTVTFAERDDWERAGKAILETIPGVVDVRYGYQGPGGSAAGGDQRRQASTGSA